MPLYNSCGRVSGILKAKQKLGVTFNFDKQDVIDFTKFSKIGRKVRGFPESTE